MSVNEIERLSGATIYILEIDNIDESSHQGIIGYYFYVLSDKIYKISKTDENLNKLKPGGGLPEF